MNICSVIDLWKQINKAILSVTENVTIADLAEEYQKKCEFLDIIDSLEAIQPEESPCAR